MRKIRTLLFICLISLVVFQTQKVDASIRVGKQYHYLWSKQANFTYEGESILNTKRSEYFFEILYIEDDRIGVKEGTANNIMFWDYELISEDSPSLYFPDTFSQPYFLDKNDFAIFYEHWSEECSEEPYVVDFTAGKRVFTYSELDPDYDRNLGTIQDPVGSTESIYDTGEKSKSIKCEYTKDGVLNSVKEIYTFIGEISEYYYEDVLTLVDVNRGNSTSIIFILGSIIAVVSISVILRRRRNFK